MVAGVLVACGAPLAAMAHDFRLLAVEAEFRADRTFRVDLQVDVDAVMLGVPPGHVSLEDEQALRTLSPAELAAKTEELRGYFQRRVRLRFDGATLEPRIEFPDLTAMGTTAPATDAAAGTTNGRVPRAEAFSAATQPYGVPQCRNHTVRLTGAIPDGARVFAFWATKTFGPVQLSLRGPLSDEAVTMTSSPATESRPYRLDQPPTAPARWMVAWQYLRLGFEHIVPEGLDHILFVLALFLLSDRLSPLLWQITAFTLAHSLTLGLAMYGVVSLSPRIVEPLIALSIAFVAIENIATSKLKPWRPAVVFMFGLLHGLGFASALTDVGTPRQDFGVALASFNVGVEAGQLSVVAAAGLVVGWFRRRSWYRPRLAIPASGLIAATGLFWTITRVLAPPA